VSGPISIQGRLLALVGAGVFIAGGALSLLSRSSLLDLEREVAREHERFARFVSGSISSALADELRLLATVAAAPQIDLSDPSTAPEQGLLEATIPYSRLWSSLSIVDDTGRTVAAAPALVRALLSSEALRSAASRSILEQRPVVTSVIASSDQARALAGIVPFRPAEGRPGGAIAGIITLPSRRLAGLLQAAALDAGVRLELVDEQGTRLAASSEAREGDTHGSFTSRVDGTPWSVVISNVGPDPLGPVATFRRRSLWLAPSLAALATLLAWGIARSVRRPLKGLTASAERIAKGDLDHAIDAAGSTAGGDEIARLASAVERMRHSLKQSIDQIERANQDLELRVAERTRELNALNARLHERERVRQELLRKVISAQEDERKRIARELHDETSQTLAALGIGVETTLATCPQSETKLRLQELGRLVHRMHQELHRLIVNLRPSVLDDLGLAAAIRWVAEWQLGGSGTAVRCELDDLDDLQVRLPTEVETAVFRAVQEAIVNISRHAHADSVLIQGSVENGVLTLEIEDDGEGFDLESITGDPSSLRGIGLLGMRERIEIISGSLEIESEPGLGTRLLIKVPVASQPVRATELESGAAAGASVPWQKPGSC
jgi:signal transduction histidine kinase